MENRYPDEPEPSWYTGRRHPAGPGDPEVSGSHSLPSDPYAQPGDPYVRPSDPYAQPRDPYERTGSPYRTGEVYRLPEQRDPEPDGRAAYESARIPVRGPEYPTIRPQREDPPKQDPLRQDPLRQDPPRQDPANQDPANQGLPRAMPARGGNPAMAEPTALVPPVAEQSRPPDAVYRGSRPVSSVILAIVAAALLLPALRLLLSATFAGDPAARGVVPAILLTLGLPLTALGLLAAGSAPGGRDAWLRPPLAYLPAGLIVLLAAGLAAA